MEPAGGHSPRPSARGRAVLRIGAALAVLIAVSVLIVILTAGRAASVQTYPADTPEGTIQRYVQALEDQDYDTAYSYFSSEVQSDLTEREFTDHTSVFAPFPGFAPSERRVSVDRVEERDDRTTIHLSIEEYFDAGFGFFAPGELAYQRPIRLTQEDGAWKIHQPLYGLEPAQDPLFGDPFVGD